MTKAERYSSTDAEYATSAVHRMARCLDVSTSGFYQSQGRSART